MKEFEGRRVQSIDYLRDEQPALRQIRHANIINQYRADHPKFNRHAQEHHLTDEQAYELLIEFAQDPKTGVQRSDVLEYALKSEMEQVENSDQTFSVAVFDIDNFKEINNELTHIGADDVLREVAKHIRNTEDVLTGDSESVIRWGGEEFVVIFYGLAAQTARDAAEHIRQRVAIALTNIRPSGKTVTVSGGVAEYQPSHHHDWKELLRAADEQVFFAKESGKNIVFPLDEKEQAA